jgi:REP element-mobilizing transposase RayT
MRAVCFRKFGISDARHLQRLAVVWEKQPVYFITTCVAARRPVLANGAMHEILLAEWKGLRARHGWAVGRHVVMPDHVHFFMMPERDGAKPLSAVIGKWKEWTAKQIMKIDRQAPPFWQPEFFDHLLRSRESRSEKWTYVRENPVRAGLVQRAEDWPFSGAKTKGSCVNNRQPSGHQLIGGRNRAADKPID